MLNSFNFFHISVCKYRYIKLISTIAVCVTALISCTPVLNRTDTNANFGYYSLPRLMIRATAGSLDTAIEKLKSDKGADAPDTEIDAPGGNVDTQAKANKQSGTDNATKGGDAPTPQDNSENNGVKKEKKAGADAPASNIEDSNDILQSKVLTLKPIFVGDTRYIYPISYDASMFSDDEVSLTISENGLLTSISADTDDRTGDAIVKLVEIGIEAFKAQAAFPAGIVEEKKVKARDIEIVFDPLKMADKNTSVEVGDFFLEAERIEPIQTSTDNKDNPYKTSYQSNSSDCTKSLCYPVVIPLKLTARYLTENGAILAQRIVHVPDPNLQLALDLTRATFVKKVTKVEFKNGMLNKITVTKPSEVLAVLDVPFTILQKIVSLPGQLLTIKVDNTGKQADLLANQMKLINAQKELQDVINSSKGDNSSTEPKGVIE